MKRKIIKQGASTLTLSLPAKWTKKYKIEAGDELEVNEKGKDLIISTQKGFAHGKVTELDFRGSPKFFVRVAINAVYLRGDDEVRIMYDSPQVLEDIQDSINNLTIGFEMVEQCSKYCVIKDISGVTDTSFESILSRIFLLTLSFAEDGYDLMRKGDYKAAKEQFKRDLNIDKFVNYCLRVLSKKGHPEFQKTMHYYTIITLLEHLADEYARLFNYLEGPVKKSTLDLFKEVIGLNREFYKLSYNFEKGAAISLIEKRTKLRKELFNKMGTSSIEDTKVLFRITKIVELITDIVKLQLAIFI